MTALLPLGLLAAASFALGLLAAASFALGLLAAASFALGFAARWHTWRRPPVLLPAVLMPCGCLRIGPGLMLPCAAHDPHAEPPVEQWAAEIGREES